MSTLEHTYKRIHKYIPKQRKQTTNPESKVVSKKGEVSFPEFSPFFNSVSRFKVNHRKLIQIRDTLTTLILKLKQKAYIIMNSINL